MLITLLLIALATYRLATDFTQEHGPFGLYRRIRVGLRTFAEGRINNSAVNDPADHPLYWLYDGADCFHCVSFWISLLLTGLATFWQPNFTWPHVPWPQILLTQLASAGLARAVHRWLDTLSQHQSTTKEEFHSWLQEYLSARVPSGRVGLSAQHAAALDQQQDALQALLSSTEGAPKQLSDFVGS